MYATDKVWSDVPLNGAAPVINMITFVGMSPAKRSDKTKKTLDIEKIR
jgi:hypothetical protein